jgi:hypothetical protein
MIPWYPFMFYPYTFRGLPFLPIPIAPISGGDPFLDFLPSTQQIPSPPPTMHLPPLQYPGMIQQLVPYAPGLQPGLQNWQELQKVLYPYQLPPTAQQPPALSPPTPVHPQITPSPLTPPHPN